MIRALILDYLLNSFENRYIKWAFTFTQVLFCILLVFQAYLWGCPLRSVLQWLSGCWWKIEHLIQYWITLFDDLCVLMTIYKVKIIEFETDNESQYWWRLLIDRYVKFNHKKSQIFIYFLIARFLVIYLKTSNANNSS